ncbi:ArsR family transcriptional regulator [Methanosarcina sp. 2.H.T.1A.6]|uniref:helix-turn-helix transcriptional regulator n=1 Tax=unclassified Methanosarcina TaxID=2644672 RepID=UPI0006224206|nr:MULTISPECIES: transcriptional regulator FilR1 domain-containing protein [unclassified Methanosarcina]KKG18119.1 ArsR family transcriptional regulator [Methanosarcina sp. 2.H.T.1A.3]KKG20068.1 ArsR family transcriptional regulator [Methanosarcina sp. 2.H.T.1A.6]KKG22732.1 ArsR family transcriptional regulator [Methanosarcina sp. 2.H.T.1A.8]KKG25487.1 ArsR family transcriptional regulator [Methanosarcina sp. 2.H.T.1A.15]
MEGFEIYKEMGDDVQAIYRSRLITEILLSLNESSRKLSQLREITGSTSQAIIPKLRKLEADHLIEAKEHEYYLTQTGKVVASRLADSFATVGTINKFKHFWSGHYLEGIPVFLLKEIGCLYESEVLKDRGMKVLDVYNNQLKIIKEAGHIHGISSVVTEGYADSISERVKEGIPVELIVPLHIAEKLEQSPYLEKIDALKDYENFKLIVIGEDIKVGLIVTDKSFSLSLYKKDGVEYDITTGLFNLDPKAIEWGESLFWYCKGKEEFIKMQI